MSFDSVFHGAPTSNDGQAIPSGNATLGIDISVGQLYYKNPQDLTQAGWQSIRVGSGGASLPITGGSPVDVGISRLGAASLAIGNGTAGDTTGNLQLNTLGLNGSPASALATSKLYIVADVAGSPQGNPIEIHSTFANGINAYVHSDTSFRAPSFTLYRSKGTQGSPTSVQNGSTLGYFNCGGYDGSAYAVAGQIIVQSNETWGATAHGACVQIWAPALLNAANSEVFRFNDQAASNVSALNLAATNAKVIGWTNVGNQAMTTGFSRLANASVALGNGTAGDFSGSLKLGNTTLTSAAPTVAASQVGLGSTTAATATAGGGQAALATVLGYLVANVGGTTVKIPYFAN